ncbi:response regulator [Actinoplanes couchii]|uniref:Response regulatory domain-containing protein n=1 Tax=Actinoplanes couchii TaxID=403638 RepID=A0ABQ3XDA0_9ACTN|nr:response regulator transcription factor [Actinoplanes couchii]MDR6321358.1 DNA-binding NarL/FixJ family response regulator [Actinoplanes couchii]GID56468.1 hypothetical protein Aco03nite_048720 [Actinoplanes couchii]
MEHHIGGVVVQAQAARRLRPDVCVLDIRMPGLDGLEVTRLPAGPGVTDPIPVVVITMFDTDEHVDAALRNRASGFLLKDCGTNLLFEAVRAAVRGDALVAPQVAVRLLRRPVLAPPAIAATVWQYLTFRTPDQEIAEVLAGLLGALAYATGFLLFIGTRPGRPPNACWRRWAGWP